jgi:hypothetical protein
MPSWRKRGRMGNTKGHVADITLSCYKSRDALQLKRGLIAEKHLRRVLDGASSRIYEFLGTVSIVGGEWPTQRTCKKTLPNTRSVSSWNMVLKITVTRSWLALT